MNIYIVGIGITQFGELWDCSPRSLVQKAVTEALVDSNIEKKKIQALFVANMLSGMLGGQEHLGSLFAEELSIQIPAYKVEGACASGGVAIHSAVQSVRSGQYETVLVIGVEKMTDHKPEEVARALMGAGSSEERLAGVIFPGLYALLARAHEKVYGTKQEDLAAVAVKNHFHASLNPKAQFQTRITVAQVMKSPCIADPLKLLDCSPISDGAAAVLLTSDSTLVAKMDHTIKIVASQMSTDTLGLANRTSLTALQATQVAARKAFDVAGMLPADIDVAEVHDCFTIAEIFAMEDLGFYKKGEAGSAIARGETTLGTRGPLVVNTSGGLKGCGHPVGATGVKQIIELTEQLRGSLGKRQVPRARIGLAQNVGGSGGTAVVHILQRS